MSIEQIRGAKKRGEKIAVLTAYDYPFARLLDESGVDIVLVGDSLGMVVLGYPDTTFVTMDDMVHHTRAAARGAQRAAVVADLPIHSYDTPVRAVENSRKLIYAGAHAVKLEGGVAQREKIAAIVAAGIPVMGHIGMLPQNVREEGGYKIKGRTPDQAAALLDDAHAIEAAGGFGVVVELVDAGVTEKITREISIPTIGIGSGPHCDGQVLVVHDLVGLFPWFKPKFVSEKANVASAVRAAVAEFVRETKSPAV